MRKKSIGGAVLLFIAAAIWGAAFVAQSMGTGYVEPFTFNAVRSVVASLFLIPCIFLIDRFKAAKKTDPVPRGSRKKLISGGVICGVVLFFGITLQQTGIAHTTAGKAGFITACYIVIVPVIGLFFKRKCHPLVWVGVFISAVGLYFLCITGDFKIVFGDILIMLCAFAFAAHILVIGHFSPLVDGVRMSCIQFATCGALSLVMMLIFETPEISGIMGAALPILYTGILSSGVAYTLQILGQKDTNPTVAALIMSFEAVFAAVAGWIILSESLSPRELFGCALVFGAVIMVQFAPDSKPETVKSPQFD